MNLKESHLFQSPYYMTDRMCGWIHTTDTYL
uniref:Uncharacterized protein n=1 Tax=Anguilla anguilla TaxID=7936 RepID=A0A0E9TCK0_ANGAN